MTSRGGSALYSTDSPSTSTATSSHAPWRSAGPGAGGSAGSRAVASRVATATVIGSLQGLFPGQRRGRLGGEGGQVGPGERRQPGAVGVVLPRLRPGRAVSGPGGVAEAGVADRQRVAQEAV